MTVQYYQDVRSAGQIAFLKLLTKWRGGIFKLIYVDFIVFSTLYALISGVYRLVLKDQSKRQFENVVRYVANSQSLIPVAFILGFYVSLVFGRFWNHFMTVPWITKVALLVACHIQGGPNEDDIKEARLQRRSIIRYLVASQILTLSRVSVPVKRRYPQISDLCNDRILLEHEVSMISNVEPFTIQPYIPIYWSTAIVMHADSQGRITNESVLVKIIKEINNFRQGHQELFLLDQMCVPLVYTQVVTLAVYSYFISCLIGRQFIRDPVDSSAMKDFYVPIFTIFQFIVYMGWLKLALTLVNPMGEDDEDFDLNTIVDYNLQVGLSIVDDLSDNLPPLSKDIFFYERNVKLPLERSMKNAACKPFMGSVYNMKVDSVATMSTSMRSVLIGDYDDNKSLIDDDTACKVPGKPSSLKTPTSKRKLSTNSLFHVNVSSVLPEEDVETEKEVKFVIPKSPTSEKNLEKHGLKVIEEEEVSSGVELEMDIISRKSVEIKDLSTLSEVQQSNAHNTETNEEISNDVIEKREIFE